MSAERTVRLLVGFSDSSVSNIVGRLLAPALGRALGRTVDVVQVAGENGALAAQQLKQAEPDGLTLGMAVPTHLIGSLIGEVRYDPLSDFCAVSLIARNPLVLAVSNSLGVRSVSELVAVARNRPVPLAYGASALGGGPHLAAVLFSILANIGLERRLYADTGELFDDLASGRIALTFNNPTSVLEQSRQGRLNMLAVTSPVENELVPGVPTFAACAISGLELTSWVGVLAPAGMPATLLAELHGALLRANASDEVAGGLKARGLEGVHSTPAEFAAHLHAEFHRWLAFVGGHRAEFPGLRREGLPDQGRARQGHLP